MKPVHKILLSLTIIYLVSLAANKIYNLEVVSLLALISLSTKFSIIAMTYAFVLTKPDNILGGWSRFIYAVAENYVNQKPTPQRHNLKNFILKAIIDCEDCITGQMALWGYLIFNTSYSVLNHIFVIALSIAITNRTKNIFILI